MGDIAKVAARRWCTATQASDPTRPAGETTTAGIGTGEEALRGKPRRTIWTDVGRGASGGRSSGGSRRGNLAALDAGRGIVDARAEAQAIPAAARAARTFWRVGADGRQLRTLVGRAWSQGLPAAHGGRRDQYELGDVCRRRDHLGSSGHTARLGKGVWDSTRAVRGLED